MKISMNSGFITIADPKEPAAIQVSHSSIHIRSALRRKGGLAEKIKTIGLIGCVSVTMPKRSPKIPYVCRRHT